MDTNNVPTLPTIDLLPKPQRNDKGQFLSGNSTQFHSGNQAAKGSTTNGRPTGFTDEILKEATEFLDFCSKNKQIPLLQELQHRLGVTRQTFNNWRTEKNEDGTLKHPDFFDICDRIDNYQELGLLKRLIAGKATTGNIFLLKTKHGYVETDKQILAGDKGNPVSEKLEIHIVEEKPLPD